MSWRGRRKPDDRTGTPVDALVVGLGNPGSTYEGTRHNLGVEVLGVLADRHGGRLRASKQQALTAEVHVAGRRVALAWPQTFMNESGRSVQLLARRFGVTDLASLVVIHDELDLPAGRLKLKLGGGLAGNNGLKSIRDHLHSAEFARVRLGVGKPPGSQSGADYVLRRPGKADREVLDVVVQEAADAVEMIVSDGLEPAMNRYNQTPSGDR